MSGSIESAEVDAIYTDLQPLLSGAQAAESTVVNTILPAAQDALTSLNNVLASPAFNDAVLAGAVVLIVLALLLLLGLVFKIMNFAAIQHLSHSMPSRREWDRMRRALDRLAAAAPVPPRPSLGRK